MANVANVKVLAGNQVQVSGAAVQLTGSGASVAVSSSQVIVTGSVFTNGDVTVGGTLTAANLVVNTVTTASTVFTSGSTKFGDEPDDSHTFTGSVNISGALSASTLTGNGSGITGVLKSVVAGPNISASAPDVNGAVTVRLSSSITSDLTTLTGLTNLSSSTGSFAVLSASTAEISGNLLVYGSAILNSNLTNAAYVKYVAAPEDKVEIFPGLKVSGSTVVSGNLNVTGSVSASSFTGSGAGLTNLPASNLSGVVPLANGGTGIDASGVTSGQLLIGSGSTLQLGDLVAGSNVEITKGSGSITIAVTGNLGVSEVTGGANISASISGPSLTVALSQSVTGLTNLSSNVISGSTVLVTGSLVASSSFARARVTLDTSTATSYDVTSTDQVIIVKFGFDDNMSINLPSATQLDGRELIIKRGDANQLQQSISVVPSGSETIDLASSLDIFGPFESKTLIADSGSANWVIV